MLFEFMQPGSALRRKLSPIRSAVRMSGKRTVNWVRRVKRAMGHYVLNKLTLGKLQALVAENHRLSRRLQDVQKTRLWRWHFDRSFTFAEWALQKLEDEHVDICMVHDTHAFEAARLLREKTGCALIFDGVEYPEYGSRYNRNSGKHRIEADGIELIRMHEISILEKLDVLLVGTRGVADLYNEIPGLPEAHVIRNCLDYQEMPESTRIREDCGLKPGDQLILYPNTVYPGCGIELLIEALARFPDHIHLAIMGQVGGGVKDELFGRIERLTLAHRVHILPLKHPKELLEYRCGADLSVIPLEPEHPNHKTCLPNRVFESIMARQPLVISHLPLIREIVEHFDMGRVFEPYDAESLAKRLQDVLSDLAHFKARVEEAANALCWEHERKRYMSAVEPAVANRANLRIVCLANKRATTNRRIFRHTRSFAEEGHDVHVLALYGPVEELRDPRITYSSIYDTDPVLSQLAG